MSKSLLSLFVAVILVVGFTVGIAYADIGVTKEIVEIDTGCDGDPECSDATACDTVQGDGSLPAGTEICFDVEIEVCASNSQNITGVVVKDRFGAELDVSCIGATSSGDCGDVIISTHGGSDKDTVMWSFSPLNDPDCELLTLEVRTDQDPGGDQSYTECDTFDFNSGPSAKGRIARVNPGSGNVQTRQVSDVGSTEVLFIDSNCPIL